MTKKAARRERITPIRVRGYPPPATGYYLVYDQDVRRLALAVYASGKRVWKFVYHWRKGGKEAKGGTVWLTLGEMSVRAARARGFELSDQVAKGENPRDAINAERRRGTLAELIDRYYAEFAEDNLRSFAQTRMLLVRHVPERLSRMRAADVTKADVKAVIGALHRTPAQGNQVLAAMSSVLAWGVDEAEVIGANPCRGIKRAKLAARERVLSPAELPRFWARFDQCPALKVLLLLGQRPGEVAAMNRAHLKDGWWEMPGEPVPALSWPGTKNGQSHAVWLPAAVMELIAKGVLAEPPGLVFGPHPNRTLRAMQKIMIQISTELSVEKATPHDLRRTHGSTICRLLGFGGRPAMNRVQNHREGGIATVYDRYEYEAETRQVMERVAAELLRIVEGREDENVVSLPLSR